MKRSFLNFISTLTISLILIFGLHLLILNYFNAPLFEAKIILAYVVNYLLALGIYFLLFTFRIKLKNQLGFLFMVGSFLKFIVFFILFYHSYKADGVIDKQEFSAFFVPYITCLIIETLALVNLLKKLN